MKTYGVKGFLAAGILAVSVFFIEILLEGSIQVAAAAFQPKSVTTGELTMTGLRPPFTPKSVTTGELTMTGLR